MDIEKLADLKLLHRAIASGWNIADDVKQKCVVKASELVGSSDPKIALLAMKILIAADSADDRKAIEEQRRREAEHARKLELIQLAVKLGLVKSDSIAIGAVDSGSSAR